MISVLLWQPVHSLLNLPVALETLLDVTVHSMIDMRIIVSSQILVCLAVRKIRVAQARVPHGECVAWPSEVLKDSSNVEHEVPYYLGS